ncbi:MAG: BlaI/MecI/CopY family transcriptional regulator [Candidatus Latescibacterota bacterium]|nr:MAG: BlaI/MecI/CopY family transcriptional regulator [Candidatus Latescibacterota bacterium]
MRLTESEWQIMNALWKNHPATAREVADELPDDVDWAYTTIKTMLTRLAAKNAVKEHKRGNMSVYEPLVTREQARRKALRSFLDQAFDGAVGPFLHFLAADKKLTPKQRQQLKQALREEESKSRGKK